MNPYEKIKICIPKFEGYSIEYIQEIIYCKADGSYTWVFFRDREPFLATCRLKIFQNCIDNKIFIRCDRSYLVNLYFVKEFITKGRNEIILINGERIKVSYRRSKEFKTCLESFIEENNIILIKK